jgi:hypothetical protein
VMFQVSGISRYRTRMISLTIPPSVLARADKVIR